MLENGLNKCTCKKNKCMRHGKCNECIEYHKNNKHYVPYCKRKINKNAKNVVNSY